MTKLPPKLVVKLQKYGLRWEIGVALLIKIVLLTGLWFLIFRWPDKPTAKPDIAAHFLPASPPTQVSPDFSSQNNKEFRHDR